MAEKLQAHARSIGRYYAETSMNSLTQAIPVSALTPIALAATSLNDGGYFNTSTYRFTPPVGLYAVSFAFLFSTNVADGDELGIVLRKNATSVRQIVHAAAKAGVGPVDGTIKFRQTLATDYWDLCANINPASGSSDRTLGSVSFSAVNNWADWVEQ